MTNKEAYIKLCVAQQEMPLFGKPWWLDIVCKKWDAVLACKGEETIGAWAYPVEQKLGINIMRTPTLTPYLGPVAFIPKDVKESNKDGYEHDIIEQLLEQLPHTDICHTAIHPGIKQVGLFKQYGYTIDVQQTFHINLKEMENTLWGNLKKATQKNIATGQKELTITNDDFLLDTLYNYHKHTLQQKEKNTHYSKEVLSELYKACKDNKCGKIWAASEGGQIEAIIWTVWDSNCCYYLMGSQRPGSTNFKAMSYLLWSAILESKNKGLITFDFEGSMDPGVEKFFRNFGGERQLYLILKKNNSKIWKIKQFLKL